MTFVASAGSLTLGRRDNFALASLEVTYKRCLLVFIADTLSSAHLQEALHSEEVKSLELVDHTENFRVYLSQPEKIEQESSVTRSYYKVELARFASATLLHGVHVPCSLESHWSGELPLPASHVYVCMCCCLE